MREPTKGTEIAALEAKRNEEQVRADGSLLGERRVAIARVVMMFLFAAATQLHGETFYFPQFVVGFGYTLWSITTLVVLMRMTRANPRRARSGCRSC